MKILIALLIACWPVAAAAPAYTATEESGGILVAAPGYQLSVAREGFAVTVRRGGEVVLEIPAVNPLPEGRGGARRAARLRSWQDQKTLLSFEYDGLRAELTPGADKVRMTTAFHYPDPKVTASLRWRMEPSGLWYGGAFQGLGDEHTLPLNQAHHAQESWLARGSTQGTPVWYSTKGIGVWVRTPHDFRYFANRRLSGVDDGMLSVEMPGVSAITYDILIAKDARELVRRIVREIGYPQATPPAEYMRLPVYTTWVEYKGSLTQDKVIEFARLIRKHNLPCGVIEIDMGWSTNEGDQQWDPKKFPDPKAMAGELHRMGIKVTLWVSNFVNTNSETFARLRDSGLLARDLTGNVGITGWWGGVAAVWDFTNPRAGVEFRSRLARLQKEYGIDGFKFDGGEGNLVPQDLVCQKPITSFEYADYFNREASAHFPWSESRVGIYSQPAGIVQRLQDKQSNWSNRNGLAAMISQAFTVSLRGFPYVMPDIVGGNEYSRDPIGKELLVRWAQASALMPLIQFSKGPWRFDEETVRLVREASELHIRFAPYTYKLATAARAAGEPLLAPLWYHAPADAETFAIVDQFMLGPDVVVAPVVTQGAVGRDIYLPAGCWQDFRSGKRLDGGTWLRGYPAPLDTLPVFTRCGSNPAPGK